MGITPPPGEYAAALDDYFELIYSNELYDSGR